MTTMQNNTVAQSANMHNVSGTPFLGDKTAKRTTNEWNDLFRRFQSRLILAPLVAAVFLTGCVSGGEAGAGLEEMIANESSGNVNTPSPHDSPGGIWKGTVTTQSGVSYPSIGLVSESGDLRFITPGSDQTSGTFTVTGNTFTANLRSYVPSGFFTYIHPVHGSASGSIHKRSALSGNTSLHDATTASFSFNYDAIYERDSSLSAISGNYSKSDGAGYTVTYSIDAAGVFTGSDTNGCMLNGHVELLNKDYNMYKANVIVTNCNEANGHYFGLASLVDGASQNDTLLFSLECVEDLIAGSITRA